MSVWAVASIPERSDFYLTGSADLTIKFWRGDNEVNSFSGSFKSCVIFMLHKFSFKVKMVYLIRYDVTVMLAIKFSCSIHFFGTCVLYSTHSFIIFCCVKFKTGTQKTRKMFIKILNIFYSFFQVMKMLCDLLQYYRSKDFSRLLMISQFVCGTSTLVFVFKDIVL